MTETAYRKVNVVDADGNLISFGGGGSGGGGDASATNQETEITRLGEIRDAISDRLPSAELTPSFISVTNSGTIASGRQSISFVNFGNNAGTLLGVTFPAGASISFAAPRGQTLGAFAYNATGTTFLIGGLA